MSSILKTEVCCDGMPHWELNCFQLLKDEGTVLLWKLNCLMPTVSLYTWWRWMVNFTSQCFAPRKEPLIVIEEDAGWAPKPVLFFIRSWPCHRWQWIPISCPGFYDFEEGPHLPFNNWLIGSQSWSEFFGEQKISLSPYKY